MSKSKAFPARVVHIVDEYKLVINVGLDEAISKGQKFLVYALSEEDLIDPFSGENLGKLEIIKGTGKAVHVQDKMTTIESDEYTHSKNIRTIKNDNPILGSWGSNRIVEEEPQSEQEPFDNPSKGDLVKPIS